MATWNTYKACDMLRALQVPWHRRFGASCRGTLVSTVQPPGCLRPAQMSARLTTTWRWCTATTHVLGHCCFKTSEGGRWMVNSSQCISVLAACAFRLLASPPRCQTATLQTFDSSAKCAPSPSSEDTICPFSPESIFFFQKAFACRESD